MRVFKLNMILQAAVIGVFSCCSAFASDPQGYGYGTSSPPLFSWTTNGAGTLTFCQDGAGGYGYRMQNDPTCYSPGPLIRLAPGVTYKLTFENDANVPTNIHTHGLHISGDAPSDDVTTVVSPGSSHTYTWALDANHPGGTNWYHSHKHEDSENQVKNGALGLVIVEDNANEFSGDVPTWASNELNLQLVKNPTGKAHRANGQSQENFSIAQNEWNRLRLSYVNYRGTGTTIAFDENIFAGTDCEIQKIANDGVWTSPGSPANAFFLSGSSRADFAIRCTGPSDVIDIKIGNSVVAKIEVDSSKTSGTAQALTSASYSIVRPAALSGLDGSVPLSNQKSIGMTGGNINIDGSGSTWDANTPAGTIAFGEVHEWTISGSSAHPFHLHLYHMMIVEGCDSDRYTVGEYYDTISSSSNCKVRFKTADFGGRMVMHCHVLGHEDNGAMVWLDVQGGGPGPGPSPTPPPTPGPTPPPITGPTPPPTPGPTPLPTPGPTLGQCDGPGNSCTRRPDSCCPGYFCPSGSPASRTCQPVSRRLLRGDTN